MKGYQVIDFAAPEHPPLFQNLITQLVSANFFQKHQMKENLNQISTQLEHRAIKVHHKSQN